MRLKRCPQDVFWFGAWKSNRGVVPRCCSSRPSLPSNCQGSWSNSSGWSLIPPEFRSGALVLSFTSTHRFFSPSQWLCVMGHFGFLHSFQFWLFCLFARGRIEAFLWSLSSAIITQFTENLSLGYKTVGNLCFQLITHRVIDVSTFQAKISFERVVMSDVVVITIYTDHSTCYACNMNRS